MLHFIFLESCIFVVFCGKYTHLLFHLLCFSLSLYVCVCLLQPSWSNRIPGCVSSQEQVSIWRQCGNHIGIVDILSRQQQISISSPPCEPQHSNWTCIFLVLHFIFFNIFLAFICHSRLQIRHYDSFFIYFISFREVSFRFSSDANTFSRFIVSHLLAVSFDSTDFAAKILPSVCPHCFSYCLLFGEIFTVEFDIRIERDSTF